MRKLEIVSILLFYDVAEFRFSSIRRQNRIMKFNVYANSGAYVICHAKNKYSGRLQSVKRFDINAKGANLPHPVLMNMKSKAKDSSVYCSLFDKDNHRNDSFLFS